MDAQTAENCNTVRPSFSVMLYIAHLAGLMLTALISLVVAWWVRRQTHDRAGTVMIALLSAHALQATFAAFQMLSSTPAT